MINHASTRLVYHGVHQTCQMPRSNVNRPGVGARHQLCLGLKHLDDIATTEQKVSLYPGLYQRQKWQKSHIQTSDL